MRSATSSRRCCSARSAARRRRRRRARTASRSSTEIREGLRLVRHDPILRAFAGAQMALAALWGIFGATWFLFVLDDLQLEPGRARPRRRRRRCVVVHRRGRRDASDAALGHRAGRDRGDAPVRGRQRVHPAGAGRPAARRDRLPGHAAARRRLGGDRLRHDRGVRPPDAGPRPGARAGDVDVPRRGVVAQLVATLAAGVLAEVIGLRATAWLAPLGGLLGAAILWLSPVRHLLVLPSRSSARRPVDAARDRRSTWSCDQPPGA